MPEPMIKSKASSRVTTILTGLSCAALALSNGAALAQDGDSQAPEEQGPTLEAGKLGVPSPPADVTLPVVETVIPDEEFNDAVPALKIDDDPELDRPLESIAEFERRIASEQAGAEPQEGQEAPLGDPALADADPVEEIGDAPISDTALAEPLPPLDQFDVEPVEFSADASDPEDVRVAYTVQVDGLKEADGESDARLRGMFKGLSALHDGNGKAANAAMVAARLTEDSELMKTILASEGWYSAQVSTRIDQPAEEGGPLVAVIAVSPGQRFVFSDIVVDAQPTEPPDLIRSNLALEVGEPIVAERVQGSEAQIAVALPENGYPFAELGQRDILLDQDTGDGIYTLPVDTGPRSRFDGFETEGDLAFDAEHIDVLARFERDELYDSRKVDDLRKALVATGLFSTVSVEPKRTGESAGDDTEYVRMLVRQDAGPPRTIAGTAGYGTGEGFRLEATWTHRNMFPPEGALIAHGVAGTKEQGAGVTFRRSNAGKRDRTFEMVAEALHSNFDAYSAYTGRVAARIARDSTPIWQKRITYAYGAELLATAEKDWDFDAQKRRRKTYYVGALNGQLGLDFTDDLLDPTKGFRATTIIQPEAAIDGGFNPYIRARIDASGYFPFGDSFVLAGRVRLGTIQGADRADIPPSRRFYSGGGGSVRGYAYQALGPHDKKDNALGGRSLNEAAAEVRYRFGNFGIVGFVDVGQSYEETMPQFSDLRFGAGIGGRYYTNFGPLRIDLATPINRRPGESRFNLYVSIGQAF
ncbi:MAG: BamA/TamA family outer membrane protein [Novosphingobium sp.]|nr:BamA/TamA family outer membrane protein [Novosphingobium sp.]